MRSVLVVAIMDTDESMAVTQELISDLDRDELQVITLGQNPFHLLFVIAQHRATNRVRLCGVGLENDLALELLPVHHRVPELGRVVVG